MCNHTVDADDQCIAEQSAQVLTAAPYRKTELHHGMTVRQTVILHQFIQQHSLTHYSDTTILLLTYSTFRPTFRQINSLYSAYYSLLQLSSQKLLPRVHGVYIYRYTQASKAIFQVYMG